MADPAGTTKYAHHAGGLPQSEDSPWTSDSVSFTR